MLTRPLLDKRTKKRVTISKRLQLAPPLANSA